MPLVPTNKIFECCGIARAVPVILNKIEVFIDFHIFAILEFDLVIGYMLDKLIQEKPSSPSLELKQCPSGRQNVVLDSGRDSTLIMHDLSLENKNLCAMDISKAATLETEEHESFSFETLHVSCSCFESPEFIVLRAACCYKTTTHHSSFPNFLGGWL